MHNAKPIYKICTVFNTNDYDSQDYLVSHIVSPPDFLESLFCNIFGLSQNILY